MRPEGSGAACARKGEPGSGAPPGQAPARAGTPRLRPGAGFSEIARHEVLQNPALGGGGGRELGPVALPVQGPSRLCRATSPRGRVSLLGRCRLTATTRNHDNGSEVTGPQFHASAVLTGKGRVAQRLALVPFCGDSRTRHKKAKRLGRTLASLP